MPAAPASIANKELLSLHSNAGFFQIDRNIFRRIKPGILQHREFQIAVLCNMQLFFNTDSFVNWIFRCEYWRNYNDVANSYFYIHLFYMLYFNKQIWKNTQHLIATVVYFVIILPNGLNTQLWIHFLVEYYGELIETIVLLYLCIKIYTYIKIRVKIL